ncbi:SPASM domain-containing protein [Longispora urticae]
MSDTDHARLTADNARLNLEESRAGAIELRSMPRYVMVELTQGCNLSCPMCRSKTIAYQERVLDRQLFRSVAEMLFPTAEMVDIRGWGESLLAPDIDDVIRLVDHYGARCRVVSNLSMTRPETFDLLVDNGAMVDISLDAADSAVLKLARPGAKMGLITRNAKRMTARLAERGESVEALRVLATLQSNTLDSLPGLVEWAAEVGVRQISLSEVTLEPGNPIGLDGLDDRVDEAVGRARAVADELGVDLYAGSAIGGCVGVKKDVEFCMHPWAYATIGFDGSVGYCDHLIGPMMPLTCMGDVTKESFQSIWNGPAWQDLRRWHTSPERRKTPEYRACFSCYKHRNVDFEDVFEPRLERTRLNLLPVHVRS